MRGVVKYADLLMLRKHKLELFSLKKLEISAPPIGEHPTITQRFTSANAIDSNEDCEVIVRRPKKPEEWHKQEIKVTYTNGVVEVLNHKQTIDELVEEFYDKRVQVETEEELEESYKEGEENPFFDQALIDEAKTQKVKVTKKQPRGMKED